MSDNGFVRRVVEMTMENHVKPAVASARSAAANATQQAVEGLQSHIARIASATQTGHVKASGTVKVAADGTMTSGYVYSQMVAATVWTVPHTMGRYVTVTVLDDSGNVLNDTVRDINGTVLTLAIQQTSVNTVIVTHAAARTGTVICS